MGNAARELAQSRNLAHASLKTTVLDNVKHIFLLQVLDDDRLDNRPNCEESVASRQYLLKQSPVYTVTLIVAFKRSRLK